MRRVASVLVLAITLSPLRGYADPEAVRASVEPAPAVVLSPAELQAPLAARAHRRKLIGRGLTLGGLGALVIALGVGVPLIWNAYHGGEPNTGHDDAKAQAGLGLSIAFGALAGVGMTAGAVLWQTGASDEKHLARGDYAGPELLRKRRRAGIALLSVGAVGMIMFAAGWGLVDQKLCVENCSPEDKDGVKGGIGLIFAGIGLGATGFVTGGLLVDEARRDRKLQLAARPGGLSLVF